MSRPVLSVVDYASWEKGYMPPSEHVLIDALSYRNAKVVMSSECKDLGWWLVMRGTKITGRRALAIMKMIEMTLDEMRVDADGDPLPEHIYPAF